MQAKQILIVEDDKITATVAAEMCRSLGCVATITTNGHDAIETYNQHHFDLILMDLQMPTMGGFEATYELRRIEEEGKRPMTPIIAVSGTMERETRVRCMQAGMDGCAEKPYTLSMVKLLLENYVTNYQAPPLPPFPEMKASIA